MHEVLGFLLVGKPHRMAQCHLTMNTSSDVASRDVAIATTSLNCATREPLRLSWARSSDNEWWRLLHLDLAHVHAIGVYVIWHPGNSWPWIKIGQGYIADCLDEQRNDWAISQYQHLGLYVTWADVSVDHVNGVEAYLGATCCPLVGNRFPDAKPIPVNLPGQ
jgi:hypothetical protein